MASPAPSPLHADMASPTNLRFLVHWFGVLYYLFPAVSFLVTKDWEKVFYDCFGTQVLIADTFTTLVTLWYHIFGPKKTEAIANVILHTLGLGLNVMSICMFAMYQSLSGGLQKAKAWYYIVLGTFGLVTLLTFMWIQMGITIEKENDTRAYSGYVLAACAEVYQVFWPAMIRMIKKNFVNDEKPIFWLKISATTVSIMVSSSELWHMIKEDYWFSEVERRFMVLSMINIIGGCLQLVARFIGPERFADPVMRFRTRCHEWKAEKWAQCKGFFCLRRD